MVGEGTEGREMGQKAGEEEGRKDGGGDHWVMAEWVRE